MATKGARAKVPLRLPALDAALILEMLGLEIDRERLGQKWCVKSGAGARRKRLGKLPAPIPASASRSMRTLKRAQDGVRTLLAENCRVCPHDCPMKRW